MNTNSILNAAEGATSITGSTGGGGEPLPPLARPVLNAGIAGDTSVPFTWAAVPQATGYIIAWAASASGGFLVPPLLGSNTLGNVTSTTVTGLPSSTLLYFALTATGPTST